MAKRIPLLLAFLATLFGVLLAPSPAAAVENCPGTTTGTLTVSDPIQTGRISRDGVQWNCALPAKSVSLNDGDPRPHKMYELQNAQNGARCASITFSATGGDNIYVSAYTHGAFSAADPTIGFLADGGLSSTGTAVSFTVNIPAHSSVDLNVNAISPPYTGSYSIDVAGCGSQETTLILQPPNATAGLGGQVQFNAVGGTDTGLTYSFVTNNTTGTIDATTGLYTAGMTAGIDTVQVVDSAANTATATVTVGGPLAIVVPGGSVPPKGTIRLTATGGNPPYTFSMQTPASGGTIGADGTYVAGTHGGVSDTVKVTDSVGATATTGVSVSASLVISPKTKGIAPLEEIAFTVSGGAGVDRVWSISPNQSGATIDGTGHYKAGPSGNAHDTVKVTDPNGNVDTADISVGGGLVISPSTVTVAPRESIAFAANGGTNGFSFAVSDNKSGATIDANTGAYTAGPTGNVTDIVTATDGNGAIIEATVTVGAPLSINPGSTTVAAGAKLGFAVAGGKAPYTFSVKTNVSGGSIDNAGNYTAGSKAGQDVIDVVDAVGTTLSATVTVTAGNGSGNGNGNGTNANSTNIGGSDNGCASSPSSGGAGSLATLAILALGVLVGRRRRRQS